MQNTQRKIETRISRLGPGSVFTPKDLLDLGSRGSVDVALSKLAKAGKIRRLSRGLYEYPKSSDLLGGPLSPDSNQIAQAIARRYRWHIVPDGALAANMLGLSTQVPAHLTYLSDGPTRRVKVGRLTIRFKHARPKQIGVTGPASALTIQALRYLGEKSISHQTIEILRSRLSKTEQRQLLRDARLSSDWIYTAARRIVQGTR
ncbi:MAG: DUF6088 family protein [Phycisphaerae bacterium]|jgi:hypothetical protein|nr:DUF6088 family protein [Phycisphaerae bacterium]